MPVTAVHLKAVEARRFQDPQPNTQIRIDHNSTITMVVKESADRLRVEFGYTTSYGPLGVVKVEGALVYQDAAAAEAADAWASTRNLPPNVAQQVHSAIMSTAVPQAVGLAKDIRLPPPIPLPQVQIQGAKPATANAPPKTDSWGSPEVG